VVINTIRICTCENACWALQALSGSGVGKIRIEPVLLKKVGCQACNQCFMPLLSLLYDTTETCLACSLTTLQECMHITENIRDGKP